MQAIMGSHVWIGVAVGPDRAGFGGLIGDRVGQG